MAKMFQGKDNKAEEMAEAKALKSGKISKAQYVAGEKKEGHGKGAAKTGAAIKSGKMTPAQYTKSETNKKMADGGMANRNIMSPTDGWAAHGSRIFKKADGGPMCATGKGPTRSKQDYGK